MRNYNYSSIQWQSHLLLIFFLTIANGLLGQVPELEIWQIQGKENVSPYEGSLVKTVENIVTAVGENSFYIQTPSARSDQDAATSDGIMIYTGDKPSVQPGDLVTVSGHIQEYYNLTEFSGNSIVVTLISTGQDLPEAVNINDQFPGLAPKDVPDLEQIECMLVQISGISTGPSDERGQFPMRGGVERSFREPGISYPGQDGYPVWDGNPEVFTFDPDALGAPDNRLVTSGTTVNATAVINQNSWGYLALPTEYTLEGGVDVRAVREKKADEITVASLNTLRLTAGSSNYNNRVEKTAKYIYELMHAPDIISFQEISSKQVLDDLAAELKQLDSSLDYQSYFVIASGSINLGFLAKNMFAAASVTQLGKNEILDNGGRVHDRPPLLLEVQLNNASAQILRVMNLHMRSLSGIDDYNDGDRIRTKRAQQATSVAHMVEEWRDQNLIVLGDFNAFEFSDGYVDVVNQIQGSSSLGALLPIQDIVDPPLRNLSITHQLPAEQYSYIFNGNAQLLDHCLGNELPGFSARELAFVRGNADQPRDLFDNYQILNRISDHDGFVLFLSTDTTVPVSEIQAPTPKIKLPNPIQPGQVIEISFEEPESYELNLVDALGRVFRSFQGKEHQVQNIWPEGIAPGTYFLTLRTKKGLFTWKVFAN